ASAAGAADRVHRRRFRHRHGADRHRQEPDRRRRQDPWRGRRGDRAGRHARQDPGGLGHHRAAGQCHPEPHLRAHDPSDHDAGGLHHRHPDVLRSGPGGDAAADLQRGPQAGSAGRCRASDRPRAGLPAQPAEAGRRHVGLVGDARRPGGQCPLRPVRASLCAVRHGHRLPPEPPGWPRPAGGVGALAGGPTHALGPPRDGLRGK
ncbi:hypothetical protein OY671_009554, partial [Metschnikowia pulcherrima]